MDSTTESTTEDPNLVETEDWVLTSDKVKLFSKTWQPKDPSSIIGCVVFIHGFGEHIQRYNHVFPHFAKNGIKVHAFDQRGFGLTVKEQIKDRAGVLGGSQGYHVVLRDVSEAIERTQQPGLPIFLMGHSMGGTIALNYGISGTHREKLTGLVISAPLIKIPKPPNLMTLYAAKATRNILPDLPLPVKVDPNAISRIPAERTKYATDPLVHGRGTLRGVYDMLNEGSTLLDPIKTKQLTLPFFLAHGSADMITSTEASRIFVDRCISSDKTYREWPGLYHELHNEEEKEEVIGEYAKWILDRSIEASNKTDAMEHKNTKEEAISIF